MVQENIQLKNITTLRVGGPARYFISANSVEEVTQALHFAKAHNLPVFIMGGGSNVVFPDSGYPGVVVQPKIMERSKVYETERSVFFRVGAGEVWDSVVEELVNLGYWGIENLSGIPGLSGAFVIQNVGAYGQEAQRVVAMLDLLEISTGAVRRYENEQCHFGYRKSVFNTIDKNRFVVLNVVLRLTKQGKARLTYQDLALYFKDQNIDSITPAQVRQAILQIRSQKLPDIRYTGTAGSFFKNSIIPKDGLQDIEAVVLMRRGEGEVSRLRKIISTVSDGAIKVPTAFLIETLGLKGYRYGGAKISDQHALVIENSGSATADDVLTLAGMVCEKVYGAFGIMLEIEPEIVKI